MSSEGAARMSTGSSTDVIRRSSRYSKQIQKDQKEQQQGTASGGRRILERALLPLTAAADKKNATGFSNRLPSRYSSARRPWPPGVRRLNMMPGRQQASEAIEDRRAAAEAAEDELLLEAMMNMCKKPCHSEDSRSKAGSSVGSTIARLEAAENAARQAQDKQAEESEMKSADSRRKRRRI